MSAIEMQSVMSDRPTGKVDFPTKWESMPASVKTSTNELFEEMKKHIGRGKIDMAPSAQTKRGMPAIMVTGWDWRRVGIKKNIAREVEPSIRMVQMELHLAKQYRPKVLADPIVWTLRSTLKSAMTAALYQSNLDPVTSGSLGIPKGWTYWDGVDVPKPTVEQEAPNDEEMLRIQHDTNVRIAAEKADRDAILKVVKQITSLKIARATRHKSSEISSDVAEATNALIQVSLTLSEQ
jgi:hypothetical protein